VGAGAGCQREVAPQDRGSKGDVDLIEADRSAVASLQHGGTLRGADVADPSGALAQHGDEVPLTLEVGDHDRERDRATRPSSYDFQRRQLRGPPAA
jgi:hypothetical protein